MGYSLCGFKRLGDKLVTKQQQNDDKDAALFLTNSLSECSVSKEEDAWEAFGRRV